MQQEKTALSSPHFIIQTHITTQSSDGRRLAQSLVRRSIGAADSVTDAVEKCGVLSAGYLLSIAEC